MENLKFIPHMQARDDGIIYFSEEGNKACMTRLSDDGTITRRIVVFPNPTFPSYFIAANELKNDFSYIEVLIFDCILIVLAFLTKKPQLFSSAVMFSLFISFKLSKLLYVIYNMKISKRFQKIAKFVAASHMALNAYYKLQRTPTLEEVKEYQKYTTGSQVVFLFDMILFGFGIIVANLLFPDATLGFCLLFVGLLIISLYILSANGLLNFLQYFVTETPSDEELKVAIEGIKGFEFMENDFEVTFVEEDE